MKSATIDDFIKRAEETAKNQETTFKICLDVYNCNGLSDCSALKNGKDKGCLKVAYEQKQLAKYLKEQKKMKNILHNIHKEVNSFLDGFNYTADEFYKLIYRIQKYTEKY